MTHLFRALAVMSLALLTIGAAPAWLNTATVTKDGGHVLGNPNAKVKLTAFESYTCHFCHDFENTAGGAIRLGYVQPGKVSLELRHVIRDPVDLTAAMLTECVPPAKFFQAHRAMYAHFDQILKLLADHTDAQEARWKGTAQDRAAGRRAIAADFGFYDIMESLGMSRPQVTQCLNNNALAERLVAQTAADDKKFDISGTPSFALDGKTLAATHTWDLLQPQIDARL
jgi:protein-disulfide isomerase